MVSLLFPGRAGAVDVSALRFRLVDLSYDGVGAAAVGAKIDLDQSIGGKGEVGGLEDVIVVEEKKTDKGNNNEDELLFHGRPHNGLCLLYKGSS